MIKRINLNEGTGNHSVNISEFIGLSRDEIKEKLDNLPVGTVITGVRDASGRYNFDTHIEKHYGRKSNYFTPMGSPHDYSYDATWWTINGSEQPYITRGIYEIVNDINKYYVVAKAELPTIYGYMIHSQMTDMCFVGCHKDEQILRTCMNAIDTFVMQTYETEEQGTEIYRSLADKGIVLGWDEYSDWGVWHDLVHDHELTNAKSPNEAWAIDISDDRKKPDWHKIKIIDIYSSRF